jgi:hypothetical protein
MKQECKDCNKSLEDCTCIEDTIELPNQALKDAAERYEKYSERFDNDESAIGNFETWGRRLVEDKQETLEEAAKRLYPLRNTFLERFKDLEQKIFINGAKWQQEQIGKSEFLQKLRATLSDAEARRLIFETFKNK